MRDVPSSNQTRPLGADGQVQIVLDENGLWRIHPSYLGEEIPKDVLRFTPRERDDEELA